MGFTRAEFEAWKEAEIDRIAYEAERAAAESERLYGRVARLEEMTYVDWLADLSFDRSKAARECL